MRRFILPCITLLLAFSCNQETNKKAQPKPEVQNSIAESLPADKKEIVRINFNEPSQKIKAPVDRPSVVIGKKGLKITIDPSALETINGAPLGKQIDIEIKEIVNQADLFKNDAPTSSDGRLLVSGGAYYIGMVSNGNELKIKKGRSVVIQMPRASADEMQLFYGERDSSGILNWIAVGEKITPEKSLAKLNDTAISKTKISVDIPRSSAKDTTVQISDLEKLLEYATKTGGRISAVEFKNIVANKPVDSDGADYSARVIEITDTVAGKKVKEIKTSYYNPVEIKSLGWINCDRFYNNPNRSEIRCEFDSSLNINSAVIYVIFKNINSVQKEYLEKTNDPALTKLKNQYPVGEPVKFIAITNVGGKFYESRQEIILRSKELVSFKFSPVNDLDVVKSSYRY